jgi:hypothetical protein
VISEFRAGNRSFAFKTHGYGDGESLWRVTPDATFLVDVTMHDGAVFQQRRKSDSAGMLPLNLGPAGGPLQVHVVFE